MKEEAVSTQATIVDKQPYEAKRNLEQLAQPGASTWLGALPLKDQGFNLNKGEFQDALHLRYDKPLKNISSTCPCGKAFTVTHAMNCHRGVLLMQGTIALGTSRLTFWNKYAMMYR